VPEYKINDVLFDFMYFLVDGIYPPWSIFVNTIWSPETDNDKRFFKQQEGCRKDVKCVFAVLEQISNFAQFFAFTFNREY
jgi:Plant transposon protein